MMMSSQKVTEKKGAKQKERERIERITVVDLRVRMLVEITGSLFALS